MDRRHPSGRLLPTTGDLTHVMPSRAASSSPNTSANVLLRNRSFLIFWGGQTLASLGNMFALIAMPLLVFQATGQVVQMGLVTATFTVSQLVAGVFAGQLIDNFNRRALMIFCDASRALIFATIPLAWTFAGPQVWLIYVVTALSGTLGMVFQVGFITTVANLVEREQIITANGYINASMAITAMIGPLLGGIAIERFSPAVALSAQALAFAVSALSLLFIRLRPTHADAREHAEDKGVRSLLAGVRFLFAQPVMRAVTILLLLLGLVAGAALDLFIFHVKNDLHQGGAAIGFVFAASSIGAIIGSLGAPWLRKRLGFGPSYLGATILSGIPFILMGLILNLYAVVVLTAIFQLASMVQGINSMSLRQEITPGPLLGRVTSAFWTISGIMMPVGAAAGTALAARIGAPGTFLWMGLLICVIGVAGIFSAARERRPEGSALGAQPHTPKPTTSGRLAKAL
ncbi:MAG TPA: MFS transporter [Ktedonobacterales bacterium]|nr:MFS transporter [Ktedonobacterales bacterium]